MEQTQYTMKNLGALLAIRVGRPSQTLSKKEVERIIDDLLIEATDAELEAAAERIATVEVQAGDIRRDLYGTFLEQFKKQRAALRATAGYSAIVA
jgi:hypothetical protein